MTEPLPARPDAGGDAAAVEWSEYWGTEIQLDKLPQDEVKKAAPTSTSAVEWSEYWETEIRLGPSDQPPPPTARWRGNPACLLRKCTPTSGAAGSVEAP